MKGLLKKDLALLRNTGKAYLVIVLIELIFGLFNKEMQSFTMGFATIMISMAGLSTLSYDDFENGILFLMSLPVSRKTYIREKYLFCFLCGVAGWLISLVLAVAVFGKTLLGSDFFIAEASCFLTTAGVMTAVMISARIRFGPEKSRVVGMAIIMVLCILGYVGKFIIDALSVDVDVLIRAGQRLPDSWILLGIIGIYVLVMLISYLYSVHVFEKKEF